MPRLVRLALLLAAAGLVRADYFNIRGYCGDEEMNTMVVLAPTRSTYYGAQEISLEFEHVTEGLLPAESILQSTASLTMECVDKGTEETSHNQTLEILLDHRLVRARVDGVLFTILPDGRVYGTSVTGAQVYLGVFAEACSQPTHSVRLGIKAGIQDDIFRYCIYDASEYPTPYVVSVGGVEVIDAATQPAYSTPVVVPADPVTLDFTMHIELAGSWDYEGEPIIGLLPCRSATDVLLEAGENGFAGIMASRLDMVVEGGTATGGPYELRVYFNGTQMCVQMPASVEPACTETYLYNRLFSSRFPFTCVQLGLGDDQAFMFVLKRTTENATEMADCRAETCGGRGECHPTLEGVCLCDRDYFGEACTQTRAECESESCLSPSFCVWSQDVAEQRCACHVPGAYMPDPPCTYCATNFKLNSGVCTLCAAGWGGEFCDYVNGTAAELATGKCNGHGFPLPTGLGFPCQCDYGYVGKYCEVAFDEFLGESACNSHGIAFNSDPFTESYLCDCEPGYGSTYCSATPQCQSSNSNLTADPPCSSCRNHWRRDVRGAYYFRNQAHCYDDLCEEGWFGEDCELNDPIDCRHLICNGSGECVSGYPAMCTCDEGFAGERCDLNLTECATGSCYDHGQCGLVPVQVRDGEETIYPYEFPAGEYEPRACTCDDGFYGANCTVMDPESYRDERCNGHGVATSVYNGKQCACDDGYFDAANQGGECNMTASACSEYFCQGIGTCYWNETYFPYGILCGECEGLHYGKYCQHDGALCASNWCSGHGRCVFQWPYEPSSDFSCFCDEGWSGDSCAISQSLLAINATANETDPYSPSQSVEQSLARVPRGVIEIGLVGAVPDAKRQLRIKGRQLLQNLVEGGGDDVDPYTRTSAYVLSRTIFRTQSDDDMEADVTFTCILGALNRSDPSISVIVTDVSAPFFLDLNTYEFSGNLSVTSSVLDDIFSCPIFQINNTNTRRVSIIIVDNSTRPDNERRALMSTLVSTTPLTLSHGQVESLFVSSDEKHLYALQTFVSEPSQFEGCDPVYNVTTYTPLCVHHDDCAISIFELEDDGRAIVGSSRQDSLTLFGMPLRCKNMAYDPVSQRAAVGSILGYVTFLPRNPSTGEFLFSGTYPYTPYLGADNVQSSQFWGHEPDGSFCYIGRVSPPGATRETFEAYRVDPERYAYDPTAVRRLATASSVSPLIQGGFQDTFPLLATTPSQGTLIVVANTILVYIGKIGFITVGVMCSNARPLHKTGGWCRSFRYQLDPGLGNRIGDDGVRRLFHNPHLHGFTYVAQYQPPYDPTLSVYERSPWHICVVLPTGLRTFAFAVTNYTGSNNVARPHSQLLQKIAFPGTNRCVHGVYAPNGRAFAVACGEVVRLFDVNPGSGYLSHMYTHLTTNATRVAFANHSRILHVWDSAVGVRTYDVPDGLVPPVIISVSNTTGPDPELSYVLVTVNFSLMQTDGSVYVRLYEDIVVYPHLAIPVLSFQINSSYTQGQQQIRVGVPRANNGSYKFAVEYKAQTDSDAAQSELALAQVGELGGGEEEPEPEPEVPPPTSSSNTVELALAIAIPSAAALVLIGLAYNWAQAHKGYQRMPGSGKASFCAVQ